MRIRNITRTVVVNHVTAYIYNKATKAMEERKFSIVGDYEDKDVESIIKTKVKDLGVGALADFEITEKESVIRSMTEEDFYNASVTVTRGKSNDV